MPEKFKSTSQLSCLFSHARKTNTILLDTGFSLTQGAHLLDTGENNFLTPGKTTMILKQHIWRTI